MVVLTGAGLSTDSGIPDYRGPGAPARMPMTYQEFVSGPAAQQRYWARSHLGWSRMRQAEPNAGHRAVATLGAELAITQNVDGLHEAVGTPQLVALHGRIADVVCLSCRGTTTRASLQHRLAELNPGWVERHAAVASRPDGDVDLDDTDTFVVPACLACGGALKPDVVFFGENVPVARVERCYAAVEALADPRRGAARCRLQPHRDERAPVRAPRGQARHHRRDRQPRRHARGRAGVVQDRRRYVGLARGAERRT